MITIYLITMYFIGGYITIQDREYLNEHSDSNRMKRNKYSNMIWDWLQFLLSPIIVTFTIAQVLQKRK